jgi:hypothetical protein
VEEGEEEGRVGGEGLEDFCSERTPEEEEEGA